MTQLKIDQIHHVAYRCVDAKATVDWYAKHLNMEFLLAIAEDRVPSTKEPDPYMHVFLDAGNGNVLAFFDPNGHRIELAAPDPEESDRLTRLDEVKWEMLEEWSETKRAPAHAAWLHAGEFKSSDDVE